MEYSIIINQKAVYDCGLEKVLDFTDLAILSFVRNFIGTSDIQIIQHGDEKYYWIAYSHLLKEMPILNLKKDSIYRRFNKLCELGILKKYSQNKEESRSFYAITKKFDYLYSSTKKDIGNESDPTEKNPMPPTEKNPMYHNTNVNHLKEINKEKDKKIIDETKKFYKNEIELYKAEPHIEGYRQFANYLFASNPFKEPIIPILKIPKQLPFDDYLKLLSKVAYNHAYILDILANFSNNKKYAKDKESIFLTINSWIIRDAKK
jgi:hypothetical protein